MKEEKHFTVVFIIKENKILLGMKKRGFGMGKYNGFGGKIEKSETILEAAERELKEECGIEAIDLKKYGILNFEFETKYDNIMVVHVFKANDYKGEIKESEEMRPEWFNLNEIPYNNMWKDDEYWLPELLKENFFKGSFLFHDDSLIVKYNLDILKEIN